MVIFSSFHETSIHYSSYLQDSPILIKKKKEVSDYPIVNEWSIHFQYAFSEIFSGYVFH